MKDKKINDADLFSQPPLLILTKGANIRRGHCISDCFYTPDIKVVQWPC